MERETLQKETEERLNQIQAIKPEQLVREELGPFALTEAVEPMQKIVKQFSLIPASVLHDLSDAKVTQINNKIKQIFATLEKLQAFDPKTGNNPAIEQTKLMAELQGHASNIYDQTHEFIAYSAAVATDFQTLEKKSNLVLQDLKKEVEGVMKSLKANSDESQRLLEETKKQLHEEGVTQLSEHYRTAAESHEQSANKLWRWVTVGMAGLLLLVSALFISGWLPSPENLYDAIQLAVGKLIAFSTLFYLLYLSGKNFQANQHNAVVNRHRQNALLTHRSMVEAAGKQSDRDIILNHAASCIYGPQPTGFSGGNDQSAPAAKSVIEMLSRSGSSTSGIEG